MDKDQRRQQQEQLDRKLLEAVESLDQGKGVELTREYLDRLYARVKWASKRGTQGPAN